MKLTKSILKELIKEEIEVVQEQQDPLADLENAIRSKNTDQAFGAIYNILGNVLQRLPQSSMVKEELEELQEQQDPMAELNAYMKKLGAADFSVHGHPTKQVESLKRAVVDLTGILYNVISLSLRK